MLTEKEDLLILHRQDVLQIGYAKEKTGFAESFIREVLLGMKQPIRSLKTEDLDYALLALIQGLGEAYGVRRESKDYPLIVAVEMLKKSFSHLGLSEIQTSYRMAFSGELDIERNVIESYGHFSVAQLGAILSAYGRKRRCVQSALMDAAHEKKLAEKQRQRKAAATAKIEWELNHLRGAVDSWREVKPYWYEAAKSRGILKRDDDLVNRCWSDAQEEAKRQLEMEKLQSRDALQRLQVSKVLESEQSVVERAKRIAQKMYLFETCIKPLDNG